MPKINLKIVTPERTVFEEEIDQATLPVTDGQVTILPNHQSYIASLKAGEICLKRNNQDIIMATSGGFIEFDQNNLVVLADTAERVEEIDVAKAEEARKRAEELMKTRESLDDQEYAKVAAAIERESNRIKIAKKHYTKKGINLE